MELKEHPEKQVKLVADARAKIEDITATTEEAPGLLKIYRAGDLKWPGGKAKASQ